MFRFSESVVTLPTFPIIQLIWPSKNRLESDMANSPDFFSYNIRDDRFTDFWVHTAQFSGNRLKKVSRLEKNHEVGPWHKEASTIFPAVTLNVIYNTIKQNTIKQKKFQTILPL